MRNKSDVIVMCKYHQGSHLSLQTPKSGFETKEGIALNRCSKWVVFKIRRLRSNEGVDARSTFWACEKAMRDVILQGILSNKKIKNK